MTTTGSQPRHPIEGSELPQFEGTADAFVPHLRAEATLVLRRRADLPDGATVASTEELGDKYGADPADVSQAVDAAEDAGLTVLEVHPASRRIRVEGTAQQLQGLFGAELRSAVIEGRTFRVRSGSLYLPTELAEPVVAVLGLDNRPQARTRHLVAQASAQQTSYTPPQLAEIYAMPDADGTGQTIAIIELGGGFGQQDLTDYFAGLGVKQPTVTAVGIDGATNVPGKDPQGADGEVLLDVEVAGAIAPGAELAVYFAPNTDAGFLDAVSNATHASPTPAAISISWGQSEDKWTGQARQAMDQAFADAEALGVVVLVAAGDNGSSDNDPSAGSHVDFPASSPHAVGCGGTSLLASGGTLTSESVWDDGGAGGATGGGVSDVFALPVWQQSAGVPARAGQGGSGRGVPDVAANADPRTGYQVLVDGQRIVIGGTSAVAPLWAGLTARVSQLAGHRLGPVHPHLYAGAGPGVVPSGLRDITTGSNGAYQAAKGWDACTGLGVPAAGVDGLIGTKPAPADQPHR